MARTASVMRTRVASSAGKKCSTRSDAAVTSSGAPKLVKAVKKRSLPPSTVRSTVSSSGWAAAGVAATGATARWRGSCGRSS
ncbi:MAG: hypothetical protein CFE45_12505, partial [Burkholderiales bacterium PBB5]